MPRPEMPIFTRTFDLLGWLVPATNHFPRAQRFTVTQRLLNAAFDLGERLEEANIRRGQQRANGCCAPMRRWANCAIICASATAGAGSPAGQYQHVAGMVDEIGRLLGGWQKVTS